MLELSVGLTYRAKTPHHVNGYVNDRTITYIDPMRDFVQYDGPAVGLGRKRPQEEYAEFLAWAERDVTRELPRETYCLWRDYLMQVELGVD